MNDEHDYETAAEAVAYYRKHVVDRVPANIAEALVAAYITGMCTGLALAKPSASENLVMLVEAMALLPSKIPAFFKSDEKAKTKIKGPTGSPFNHRN